MAFAQRRSTRARLLIALLILFGIFVVYWAISTGTRGWTAFTSGGVATATVQGQDGTNHGRRDLVTFTTSNGTTRTEWMGDPDLRVGDQVKIRYNQAHPDNLYPASDLIKRTVIAPLFILVMGLAFIFTPFLVGLGEGPVPTRAIASIARTARTGTPGNRTARNRTARNRQARRRRRHQSHFEAEHPRGRIPNQE